MPLSSHAKRLATALILLPALVFVILAGGWWLFAAVLLGSLVGLWEFYSLFWRQGQGIGKKFIGLGLAVLFLFAAKRQDPELIVAVLLASFWIGNLFFLFCYSKNPGQTFYTNAAVLVSGLLYLPFVLHLPLFFTPAEIFFVLAATIATDVGGYYAGSMIGGPKIWPQISPKKTWAGSLGGLVLCLAVVLFCGFVFGRGGFFALLLVGVAMNVAGQLGDFFESALKRWLGVKDSGHILPGHGGILDRIDGLLLVIPVYAAARSFHDFF